jgi:LmbE family N-acetylglucosaminyl deacetylase
VNVTAVTVFTADRPPDAPLSALARRSHASWGAGDQPFASRRKEDDAALALLGAAAERLGLLDAIYRLSPAGSPLYDDPLVLPAPDDIQRFLPSLVATLGESALATSPLARVFCPSGIGGHVDHVLTRQAVEWVLDEEDLVYYEEYPYSVRPGVASAAPDEAASPPRHTLALTAEELEARIAAIACYASQLRGLFPSEAERIREIASARIPVVGDWLVRPPDVRASSQRMASQVRHDVAESGGERYLWSPRRESPFPVV